MVFMSNPLCNSTLYRNNYYVSLSGAKIMKNIDEKQKFYSVAEMHAHIRSKYKWYDHLEIWWWALVRCLHPKQYINEVKWFFQRIHKGWRDCDVWSIDYYLSTIIPQMVRHLRDTTHSYPYRLGEKRWKRILTTIAEGFEENQKIVNGDYILHTIQYKEASTKAKRGMALFIKYYNNLWD